MKSSRYLILMLATALIGFGCSSTQKYDAATPEGAMKAAEQYEKDGRLDEAIQQYQDVKNKFPYSRFAKQAELKVADTQYTKESFVEAQSAYQLYKDFHPKDAVIDYVTFRLGMSIYKQLPSTIDRDITLTDKALLYFEEVINSYPGSQYLKEAQTRRDQILHMQGDKEMYIANYYFKQKIYDSSLKRFETVLKNYPNLGLDAEAMYGAAKSAFEIGEKERGLQHAKNLIALFPESHQAKKAAGEFKQYGLN